MAQVETVESLLDDGSRILWQDVELLRAGRRAAGCLSGQSLDASSLFESTSSRLSMAAASAGRTSSCFELSRGSRLARGPQVLGSAGRNGFGGGPGSAMANEGSGGRNEGSGVRNSQ